MPTASSSSEVNALVQENRHAESGRLGEDLHGAAVGGVEILGRRRNGDAADSGLGMGGPKFVEGLAQIRRVDPDKSDELVRVGPDELTNQLGRDLDVEIAALVAQDEALVDRLAGCEQVLHRGFGRRSALAAGAGGPQIEAIQPGRGRGVPNVRMTVNDHEYLPPYR